MLEEIEIAELLPEEKVTKSTYDALASVWANEHSTPGFWRTEMVRFHELLPGGKVIEVGAGGARDAKELIKYGYDYIGTDVSSGLLDVARKELPDYPFFEQSVYDLDFNEKQFDGFWASAVLLHIPKRRIDEALQRIRTVVKARAIGFISIKDGEGESIEEDQVGGKHLDRFFAYWSKEAFAEHLKVAGFIVVDYSYRPMSEKTRWHCFFVEAVADNAVESFLDDVVTGVEYELPEN